MGKSRNQLDAFKKNRNRNTSSANAARSKKADDRAIGLVPVLKEILCEGALTYRDIARGLVFRDIRKARGGHIWFEKDIGLLLARIAGLHSDVFSEAEKVELFACYQGDDAD